MNRKIVLFVVIALLVGVVTYIALDNLYIALGVLAVYLITSFMLFLPMLKRFENKVNKYHECYHFINNFAIALSIKKSVKGALESTVASMPQTFIDIYEGLENMNDHEKLNYLSTYFSFHVYRLFLQIVSLWEEEGGDILKMSKYLIDEVRNNEEYISQADTISTHKYIEIGILWLFCLAILIVLRFALKDFYSSIKEQMLYVIATTALMAFILFSIFLLIKRGTFLELRGYSDHEKNI